MTEDLPQKVNRYLINETDFLNKKDTLSETQLGQFIEHAILQMCKEENITIPPEQRRILTDNCVSAVVSLGPLRPLMEDKSITEIMVNGFDNIYIQREGKISLTEIKFTDNRHLLHTIQKLLGTSGTNKRVDESSPYVDFSLPDGSRVNVIIAPCSMVGPVMTIRKFRDDITTVEDLINLGTMDKNIAILLTNAVKAKLNIVFCGATGSGKTTLMNVFSKHIPEEERIITIEDTPELLLKQEHVVTLMTKPPNFEGKGLITMRDLFVNSLRMRPDRIIVGEVRGEEILDLIQSITSGHSGSLAIVHAETPEDCFNRMVTMMLMTGIRLSTEEIQRQVAKAVDLIVHCELYMDGVRRVSYVTDLFYHDMPGKVVMNDVLQFVDDDIDQKGNVQGHWRFDKRRPSFIHKFTRRRVQLPEDFFDE